MKTAIKTTILTLLGMMFIAISTEVVAQQDTAREPVVFENKLFKIKFYDKGNWLDSTNRKELEEALSEVEEEMQELQEELAEMEDMKEGEFDNTSEFYQGKNRKKPKLVETSTFVMDLGLNAMLNNNSLDMPQGYELLELDRMKSLNFHLSAVQQGINISQGKLRFVYGLGIEFNNYRFVEDIDFQKGQDKLTFAENDEKDYRKNKLVSQYLTMPLMLNFKSKPRNEDESFNIAAGIQLGYLVGSHTKQKWGRGRDKEKRKNRGDFNFEEYRYGYVFQMGYGDFNLYGKYYPTGVFKKNKGPQLQTASLGLVLTPF